MLKDKKILLAVCGSISFYKSYEILSALKKLGADVKVMLSDGVLKFCTPDGFEALSPHPVLYSSGEKWQDKISHIEYGKVDLILIAPASVNTINSLANGICTNVFMQTLIASSAPILIAPAANHKMIEHFSTQKSMEFLKQNGVTFIEPITKILACGDMGKGALADHENIIYYVKKALCKNLYNGKKVIITGGSTTQKIDDVRGITNNSSGKMAKALADAFYYAGAEVVLATSKDTSTTPYKVLSYQNTDDLLQICKDECFDANILVMCAAVSDYITKNNYEGKLKKSDLGDFWNLELIKNIDILSSLKEYKCKKIGFKLEFDKENAKENAKKMLLEKELDGVCLNIADSNEIFGSQMNEIEFITHQGSESLRVDTKENISIKIARIVSNLL